MGGDGSSEGCKINEAEETFMMEMNNKESHKTKTKQEHKHR